MTELPKRKSVRLKGYDYSQNGLYFVTICTQDRQQIFGEITANKMVLNDIGKIIENNWELLPNRFPIELAECQIMPNHMHSIIHLVGAHHDAPDNTRAIRESPLQKRSMLSQIIGYLKMNTTKQIRILKNYKYFPVWQRNYYEHIIRNEQELDKIQEYIKLNPQLWERDRNNPNQKL